MSSSLTSAIEITAHPVDEAAPYLQVRATLVERRQGLAFKHRLALEPRKDRKTMCLYWARFATERTEELLFTECVHTNTR